MDIMSLKKEKLINMITYFVKNTKYCYTLKLFKLLFFSDFEHYRQTGRTITGLEYKAFPRGPVPEYLWKLIKNDELKEYFKIITETKFNDSGVEKRTIKPLCKLETKYFTKRELNILEHISFLFKELNSDNISSFSHYKNSPWDIIYDNGKGRFNVIPAELSLKGISLVNNEPTIEKEELEYRKSILGNYL